MARRKRQERKQSAPRGCAALLRLFLFRLTRFIIGLLLLPAALAVCYSTYRVMLPYAVNGNFFAPIVFGAVLYAGIFLLGWLARKKSNILYVAAHEFSHALVALVFGAKVLGIDIRSQEGQVRITKTNFLIGLAPYFLPLYAWLVVAAYYIIRIFYYSDTFYFFSLFAIGFFLSFHFIQTTDILIGPLQPDLQEEGGRIFSFPVIIMLSCLSVLAILFIMNPAQQGLKDILSVFVSDQKTFYRQSYYAIMETYRILGKS